MTSLFWFRRDLRLSDNRALYEATQASQEVLCVFILDPINSYNKRNKAFIKKSLSELHKNLGGSLLYLEGEARVLIPQIVQKYGVKEVFANEEYEPKCRERDFFLTKHLSSLGTDFFLYKDHVIFRGDEVLKKDGKPYKVFTPYKRKWLESLSKEEEELFSYEIKTASLSSRSFPFPQVPLTSTLGGEREAKDIFANFLTKIDQYHEKRDFFSLDACSNLSPYLRFGNISIRELVRHTFPRAQKGPISWLSELIWRDFYQMITFQFPHVVELSFKEKYKNLHWPGKKEHLEAWKKGETGYPIIDASMKYLKQSGKMHNRLRMITASFLSKDLLISWQEGEKYFSQHLLDYDLASNNGGWQWASSTGCDAQPYFRIFNPITQSKKFDPEGKFITSMLPCLKKLPPKYRHFPLEASEKICKESDFDLRRDYLYPIVDHGEQRKKALNLFKEI